jgi:hypothetical protein
LAEVFQAALNRLAVAFLEISRAKVDVLAVVFEHVPDDDQDAESESRDCALLTTARGDVMKLAGNMRVFGARGGVCCLDARRAQPLVAFAGLALTRAFVVAGAHRPQEARWAAVGKRLTSVPGLVKSQCAGGRRLNGQRIK